MKTVSVPTNFFSFSNIFPVITIALLKAMDEVSTWLLVQRNVNNTGLEGEVNSISAAFYSFGSVGYFLIWIHFLTLFSAVYFGLQILPAPIKIRRIMAIAWFLTVTVIVLLPVIGNLTY